MNLRESVLEFLGQGGKPLSVREIARRLKLDKEARHELNLALRGLIEDGEIVKIRGARVGLPARMNLVAGRLTCNAGGFGFVAPENRLPGQKDVYVAAANMKEALHGDRVVARVERVSPKGPEGRIIRVLERHLSRIVGRYEVDGPFGGHVVPFDRRVLHELFVPVADSLGAEDGVMVEAEITRPPTGKRSPLGRVLKVLGSLKDPGVDMAVIIAKYDLPESFPAEVEEEAGRVPTTVRPEDIAARTDFRPWATVTVDPETARDHDDAISLDRLPNGNHLLAVHIADVAHYVPEGTALDQEAYLRGTSIYFPDRVVPMLPHALSSGICSLVEGEDRLTQTVVMEIDGRGRVVRTEFHDGVIRSVARTSYQQAQAVVDGDSAMRARFAPLVALFERMDALAKVLRKRRHERGSLDFDLPEPKLILGASGEMTGIVATERLDSMRMIEEFMLAANEAVAERLSNAGVPALYRIHERPDAERVEEFSELVASLGYRLPADQDEITPQDFQRVLKQIQGKPEEKLVSYLLLRTMKLARYHEENLGHFGLATGMYAHFTSPIRRYPDLVVHRALRALRKGGAHPASAALAERMPEMALHLSERERKATDAERELVEWKKVRFMASRIGEVYSGYVTGVQSFGLFVELQEVYVQGLVHVSSMGDDYYGFDEKAHRLLGENTGKSYRLGDVVKVRVVRVDQERRQVDLGLEDVIARVRDRGTARPPKPRSEKGASARPRGRAAAGSGGSRKAPKPRNPAPPRNRRKRR